MAAAQPERTGAGPQSPRVLLISLDPVGLEMAGLGIRYHELARVLARHARVTLAATGSQSGHVDGVEHVPFRPHAPAALKPHIDAAEVIVAQPQWPVIAGWMRRSKARLIYDLYDPEALETLELFSHRPAAVRALMVDLTLDRLNDALADGDHFICASEQQRDLWLGALLARRLIDGKTYDQDPSFRTVIDTVPFGLPAEPPVRHGAGPRERFRALAPYDEIVLWNGGIWNWLDAPTAVRALALLGERRPRAKLVFMGGASGPAGERAAAATRAEADRLGLTGRSVFFNEQWVSYAERGGWLLDAACAVSTHSAHLETHFAFRTRILDCFWSGLPVVCTEGDALADRIAADGLGETVPAGDAPALADALARVLDGGRERFAPALARAANDYRWPVAAANLVRMIEAADVPRRRRRRRRDPGHAVRAGLYRAGHRLLDMRG